MSFGAQVVDWDSLLKVVLISLGAGAGVTAAFSLVIYGSARFADMRRGDRAVLAAGFGLLAVLALAAVLGACVLGITLVLKK
jgi:hypothetical protein